MKHVPHSRNGKMANNVNMDALVRREDFEAVSANEDAPVPQTITIRDLERDAFFYLALRKPDFQRESSEWDSKRVAGLVKTFLGGDLIPSVILWKHREHLFVIDGAHRLSALIAWVQDDFGDGDRSYQFFGHAIPPEQRRHADRTRELVKKDIGSYADHVSAAKEPEKFGPDLVASSRALGSRMLSLQWVRGDSAKAEKSFVASTNKRYYYSTGVISNSGTEEAGRNSRACYHKEGNRVIQLARLLGGIYPTNSSKCRRNP